MDAHDGKLQVRTLVAIEGHEFVSLMPIETARETYPERMGYSVRPVLGWDTPGHGWRRIEDDD